MNKESGDKRTNFFSYISADPQAGNLIVRLLTLLKKKRGKIKQEEKEARMRKENQSKISFSVIGLFKCKYNYSCSKSWIPYSLLYMFWTGLDSIIIMHFRRMHNAPHVGACRYKTLIIKSLIYTTWLLTGTLIITLNPGSPAIWWLHLLLSRF